ncbi:hypothetical protein QMK19_36425 [Streptomyces sp. H10-C2]|uniref:hypothetical protein n=1 Tax=unclassified Streptomyces TaxID=2593676 RepID=UPI0024BB70AE|nr:MULTISPECIES: hypothetical protein [unclassified Streptomyces]MDJ0346350.1 hypothetical protein [Streptomyces sp. PH10-H1]MDJ0374960.1 hypothetical protein [Streptomyces sp. H10-C2]
MTVHRRPLGTGPHLASDPDRGRAQRALTPAERAVAAAQHQPADGNDPGEPTLQRRSLGDGPGL